jgi:RNA polymerase sigma factor (sigma-70 family)
LRSHVRVARGIQPWRLLIASTEPRANPPPASPAGRCLSPSSGSAESPNARQLLHRGERPGLGLHPAGVGRGEDNVSRESPWSESRAIDRRLVKACLRGEEDAWTTVWDRYGSLVKAVARRTGCDAEESRDVVQRVALVALQNLGSLANPDKLAGWLAGVARYQSLELIRQRRPSAELDGYEASVDSRADDSLIRDQELAVLRVAFVRLEDRCRRLLHRLELKEPADSYRDVAADEGLSETSIGPIRRRCMQRLRKLVEQLSRTSA